MVRTLWSIQNICFYYLACQVKISANCIWSCCLFFFHLFFPGNRLTLLILNFELINFCYIFMCLKTAEWVASTVDPNQMSHYAASDLGLHCLFQPICLSLTLFHLNFEQVNFCYIFMSETAEWVASSVDPDQDAILCSIWFGSTHVNFSCLSVQISKINTINIILNPYVKKPCIWKCCLCRQLNILANFSNLFLHTGKQCEPRSDCS